MAQTTITQIQGTEETTVVVKRPKPTVEEAKSMVRGLVAKDGGNDENLLATYDIAEFCALGVVIPDKFRKDGKPCIHELENKKGEKTLYFKFLLNNQWVNAYLSHALQGEDSKGNPDPTKAQYKLAKGDFISKSKHAIQLRLNPDAKENESPCFYLLTVKNGGSGVVTADDFAD